MYARRHPDEVAKKSVLRLVFVGRIPNPDRTLNMARSPADDYLEKVAKLPKIQVDRLLSRSRNKLMRRMLDKELTPLEVAAIQMQIEDEDLAEWRARMAEIHNKEAEKAAKTATKAEKKHRPDK